MPSRVNRAKPLIYLQCIVYCASCARLPQTCSRCSLSCDESPELKQHEIVHVLVEQRSDTVLDEIHNVSSLCDGGHCSVPGCFHRDTRYSLKIFDLGEVVPKLLIDNKDVQPDCAPESVSDSDRSNPDPDDADMKRCNKLLILLTLCLWILLHLRD